MKNSNFKLTLFKSQNLTRCIGRVKAFVRENKHSAQSSKPVNNVIFLDIIAWIHLKQGRV